MTNSIPTPTARSMLNKVPEVTAAFLIITVLASDSLIADGHRADVSLAP
ncbi:hypothetical protein BH10ACT6_BH10ACT6_08060 [soil metagenome]